MEKQKTERHICYISVYSVGQAYGGPEEGGWWYTTYEHEASIPFEAEVTFRLHVRDDADPNDYPLDDVNVFTTDEGEQCWWEEAEIKPLGTCSHVDADAWDWVRLERKRLMKLYGMGEEDEEWQVKDYPKFTLADGNGYLITREWYRGRMELRRRPVYC
jgi:hypothetical protein